jgi:hypothetical protein
LHGSLSGPLGRRARHGRRTWTMPIPSHDRYSKLRIVCRRYSTSVPFVSTVASTAYSAMPKYQCSIKVFHLLQISTSELQSLPTSGFMLSSYVAQEEMDVKRQCCAAHCFAMTTHVSLHGSAPECISTAPFTPRTGSSDAC